MAFKNVGALWKKKSAKGVTYLGGNIEMDKIEGLAKVKINVYINDKKTEDKQPDYRIVQIVDDQPPTDAPKEDAPF